MSDVIEEVICAMDGKQDNPEEQETNIEEDMETGTEVHDLTQVLKK